MENVYNFDKNGFPLIKVLMRTYGEHKTLTEEAIYSFLQQDYPNKKLIILNTHKDPIKFDKKYDNIITIEMPCCLSNMSEKTKYLIEQVKSGLFCIFDDDDIILQNHLFQLYDIWKKYKKDNKEILCVSPGQYFYHDVNKDFFKKVGYTNWCCYLFDINNGIKFYNLLDTILKHEHASGQDSFFMNIYKDVWKKIEDGDFNATYIYRWGTGSYHLSGGGRCGHKNQIKKINSVNIKDITEEFCPHTRIDYTQKMEDFIFLSVGFHGGIGISKKCWMCIKTFLQEINCKKIIEFGADISTKLLNSMSLSVFSIETKTGIIEKLKETEHNIFIHWDGKEEIKLPEDFNVSFIDGPFGGKNREYSYKISSESPNIEYVICHDVDRVDDRVWINKYLMEGWILYKTDNRKIEIYKREK